MLIRKANIGDINQIVPIMIQIAQMHYDNRPDIFKLKTKSEIEHDLKEILKDKEKNILISVNESKVLGILIYKIKQVKEHANLKESMTIWIEELGVSKENRRQGIGKMLMSELKKITKDIDCQRIELNCWEFNEDAIEFYKSQDLTTQRRIMEIQVGE